MGLNTKPKTETETDRGVGLSQGVDLSNEQEIEEYLKNLGTEYRFGCYQEKNPKGEIRDKFQTFFLKKSACRFRKLKIMDFFEKKNRQKFKARL